MKLDSIFKNSKHSENDVQQYIDIYKPTICAEKLAEWNWKQCEVINTHGTNNLYIQYTLLVQNCWEKIKTSIYSDYQ